MAETLLVGQYIFLKKMRMRRRLTLATVYLVKKVKANFIAYLIWKNP
jgi:hypothetical protein